MRIGVEDLPFDVLCIKYYLRASAEYRFMNANRRLL